jgi:hypothetical protein
MEPQGSLPHSQELAAAAAATTTTTTTTIIDIHLHIVP